MPGEADAPRRPTSRGALLPRIGRAWHLLSPDARLAATAAIALFVTMFLPWYQQNAVISGGKGQPLVSQDLTAFGVFSFVEAAVLLVAFAVLVLLFARAEQRPFHLPGGDGTIIMIAGGWIVLLLVWRLFDKPGIESHGVAANVGIQWGIFFALAAAGLLTYAGRRMRASRRPEPPRVDREPHRRRPPRATGEPQAPGTAMTRVLPPEEAPTEVDRGRRPYDGGA